MGWLEVARFVTCSKGTGDGIRRGPKNRHQTRLTGNSANDFDPVWTCVNHLIMTNKHMTVMLIGQRPADRSRSKKSGDTELDLRQPTEGARVSGGR